MLLIAAAAVSAWLVRFVQDDAFISYRFARNWADGLGPVFNPGERVEGYTNFLWTALLTIPHAWDLDPVVFSQVAGLVGFVLTLAVTWRVGLRCFGAHGPALAAVGLLATQVTFVRYATGGLETSWQAALAVAAAWLAGGDRLTALRCAALSLVIAAGLMLRLDSAVLLVVPGAVALAGAWRISASPAQHLARTAAMVLPGALVVLAWLGWKMRYYGDVLPNTYYAKAAANPATVLRGGYYVVAFFASYFLWPFALLYLARLNTARRRLGVVRWALLTLPAALWLAYVVKVGGDFMEFRFMVPVMPLLALMIAWVGCRLVTRPGVRWALALLVVGASALHGLAFDRSPLKRGVESFADLERHVGGGPLPWIDLGRAIGRDLDHPDRLHIAITAAGAVPYYSRARTTDMLGLCDAHVARHGAHLTNRPGHNRVATIAYLVEREVVLLIGHPQPAHADGRPYTLDLLRRMYLSQGVPDPENLPADAAVVEIPIDDERACAALYLKRNAQVDRALAERGWRLRPLTLFHIAPGMPGAK